MQLRPKTLRVYPNPWGVAPRALLDSKGQLVSDDDTLNRIDPSSVTLDAQGRPCGATHVDLNEHDRSPGRMVACSYDTAKTVITQTLMVLPALANPASHDNLRNPLQTTVRSYLGISAEDEGLAAKLAALDPETLPYTGYYRERIGHGELIAADASTAQACGVAFVDPKKLLPALESAAEFAFNKHFDDVEGGAVAFFRKSRADETKAAVAPAPAVAAAPYRSIAPSPKGDSQ